MHTSRRARRFALGGIALAILGLTACQKTPLPGEDTGTGTFTGYEVRAAAPGRGAYVVEVQRNLAGVVTVPSSIPADGSADVTAALNQFIAQVPAGSTILFPAGGRYRIEGTVVVKGRSDLMIHGNGSLLYATTIGSARRSHFRIESSTDIVVTNLKVKGGHPNPGAHHAAYDGRYEWQHGFDVSASSRVLLDTVEATDVYGDHVFLGQIWNVGPWTDTVVVRNSTFARNGRQGVAFTGARNVTIAGNRFEGIRASTFDFEPEGPPEGVDNVLVTGNTVGSGLEYFVAAGGPNSFDNQVDNITIEKNVLLGDDTLAGGKPMIVFAVADQDGSRKNWKVIDNRAEKPMWVPLVPIVGDEPPHIGLPGDKGIMYFAYADNVTVRGNVQHFIVHDDATAVQIVNSCRVDVSDNDFHLAARVTRTTGTCPWPAPADDSTRTLVPQKAPTGLWVP